MTEHRRCEVRRVEFSSGDHDALPVEVLDYRELVDRVGPAYFAAAQRTSFGLVMLVRSGAGQHTVDFEDIRLVPGRLFYVRPQQVQHWHVDGDVDAAVVVEAKRLLAHTDDSIGGVSTALGFSEATNFNKFFSLRAGERPAEFRDRLRVIGYAADDAR